MDAPANPAENFDCQASRKDALYSTIWIFWGIATIVYILRLYTRMRLVRELGWDDLLMGFAWGLQTGETVLVSLSTDAGLGKHLPCLMPEQIIDALKWQAIAEPLGIWSSMLGRAAVSILIGKVLNADKKTVIGLWALNALSLTFGTIEGIIALARCTPIEALWNPVVQAAPTTHCISQDAYLGLGIFYGAVGPFCDFILALYALVVISKLQLNLKKKMGICGVMCLGIVAGIVGSIRTADLRSLANVQDFTWATVDLIIFVLLECDLLIICGCVPVLGPLFHQVVHGSAKRSTGPSPSTLRAMKNSSNGWLQMGNSRKKGSSGGVQDSIFELEHGV